MDLNKFGKRAYNCALKRGKITEGLEGDALHAETLASLYEEVNEVGTASEIYSSNHIPLYTEVEEELIDVAIVVMTELHRRGTDINQALHDKMKFNEMR